MSGVEMPTSSKRKQQQELSQQSSSSSSNESTSRVEGQQPGEGDAGSRGNTVFRQWLDEGTQRPDGRIDHDLLRISIGDQSVVVSLGDTVQLRRPLEEEDEEYHANKRPNTTMIARLERMWEEPASESSSSEQEGDEIGVLSKLKIRARWFLNKHDVMELREKYASEITGDLTSILTSRDVLLSNQTDDNGVTAICAPCYVIYRQPNAEDRIPDMPNDTFVCRYSLDFGGDSVDVVPYEGEDDDWRLVDSLEQSLDGDDDDGQGPGKRRRHEESQDENTSLEDKQQSDDGMSDDAEEEEEDGASENSGTEDSSNNDVDSDTRNSDDNDSSGSIDGEGSTEKRNTRIGNQHQAVVPKFVPNQRVVDRNPTLVWEPGNVSEDDLDRYFELAANILTPFLRQNELTPDDPYSPVPMEQMESEAKRANGAKPTLSAICTASSLSLKRNNLLRECNADALLDILSQSDYSISSAVNAIKASPRDFLTAWSPEEKEIFNSGFRRYSGSLRMISKGIAPTKDFKDVIDYHYRFKVPDQFRRFQDKKREQAVRMIECIETRRYIDNVIRIQNERGAANENGGTKRGATGQWAKTSTGDVTGDVEERRVSAKQLLLDLERKLGPEKLAEVANAIKRWHQESIPELQVFLVEVLRGQTELLERFLDFLPKRRL